MQPTSAPTPAPIHEIVDAMSIFPYPLWMVLAAALVLVALLASAVWFFFFRPRPRPVPTARERAIAALARLQGERLTPYEFGIRISDILRRYIDEAFGIRATTATSLEFLDSIRGNPRFSTEETASLEAFLDAVDLIKFARVEAGGEELGRLFECAESLIRKEMPGEGGVKP